VLYELTVGRRPFRGETDFAIMDQIVYKGAPPPSEIVAGYPPELEAIVMKLLERGASMRYATGEDLLHELDDFIGKHGLWLSPRAIGKYMRTLFADGSWRGNRLNRKASRSQRTSSSRSPRRASARSC
jgi:serine/threonine-protein kinase